MPQTTETQRVQRINELLQEALKQPPSKQPEGEKLPAVGSGEALTCPVISISVDEVVLNPNSHRIKAQLNDEPEWADLQNDPYSEPAQVLIRRMVRSARKPEAFAELQTSLLTEGQDYPGVITHKGVLINANTRAVAIGEFEDPDKRFIRVAVLPPTVQEDQLALLELRLQMRKEMKAEYSLTNELLFIEELSDRGLTDKQIAKELRLSSDPKKGEKEVQTRLQLLDLIRELRKIPQHEPRLTFFDVLSYEQLRDLLRDRDRLLESSPEEAERLLQSFLLSTAVGVTPVHSLRQIDSSFMDDYMYPQLEEDEELGAFAAELAIAPAGEGSGSGGGSTLGLPGEEEEGEIDLTRLIGLVIGDQNRVKPKGTKLNFERSAITEALADAVKAGIKEKRRDARDEDKLEAPLSAVKAATKKTEAAVEAAAAIAGDGEFEGRRKKSLEAAFKKLRRRHRELESKLEDLEIVAR